MNASYAPDLAFLPLHNELRDSVEDVKNMYCTIVTSTLWKQYANTYDEYINGVKRMAYALNGYTGKRIMILPHSTYSSDIQITKDVEARCSPRLEKDKFVFALVGDEAMTPSKARAALANSYLNVSFRMHGAISSLESGVPVVAIAYSPKYKGVISDGYTLPKLVVEKMSRRNWQKCIKKTIATIKYATTNRSMLCSKITKTKSDVSDITSPLYAILEESQ